MGRLQGKVALVTGATSGIGAACARRFSEEGARVAGVDLAQPTSPTPLEHFAELDVRDEGAVAAAVDGVVERFGRLDVLLNAAGVSGAGVAHDLDVAEWDRVVDINLKGSFLTAKHALRHMLGQRSGSIIHVASVEGIEAVNAQLAYNVSKAGVIIMTRNMALDYGPFGIRVNCLCPGAIDTPMTRVLDTPELRAIRDELRSFHALDRFGTPEEVAAAAVFLASDEASFVTGTPLIVDGGFTAGRRIRGIPQS